MNISYRFQIFLLLLSLVTVGNAEPAPTSGSLAGVVETVINRSPSLKAAAAKVKQAESGLQEARSMDWPQLSLQSSAIRSDNPVFVFGSLLNQKQFGAENFAISKLNNPGYLTNINNTLMLGMPLFMGLEIQSHKKMGAHQVTESQAAREYTAQAIRLLAIQSYLASLHRRQALAAIDDRLASSAQEVESARKLNARGVVLGSDYYAALAIYSGLSTQRVQMESEARSAEEKLSVLLGQEANLKGNGQFLTNRSYPLSPADQLLSRALERRPDLKIAAEEQALAEIQSRQEGRSFWPRIDAFASVGTNTEDFSSNPSDRMIGVRSNFVFGDPAYRSRHQRAKAQAAEAQTLAENASDQAKMDFYQAYRQYQAAVDSLVLAEQTVEQAQKSLELFRPLYREGRQSIIEVLRAEEGLFRAQSAYLGVLYQLHASYAQLQYVMGSLDEAAVSDMNGHLNKL